MKRSVRSLTKSCVGLLKAQAISSGLNLFPRLQTIGTDIARCYKRARSIRSPGISFINSMEILAEMVPTLRSVHIEQGILFMVGCDRSGAFKSVDKISCLDGVDIGATALSFGSRTGWKTRPRSQKAEDFYKRSRYADVFIRHYEPDPSRDPEAWSLFD